MSCACTRSLPWITSSGRKAEADVVRHCTSSSGPEGWSTVPNSALDRLAMDISSPPQPGSRVSAGSDREDAPVQETGIGSSLRRKEDARFLTGRGRYVDDFA